jgi:hypothetical protein
LPALFLFFNSRLNVGQGKKKNRRAFLSTGGATAYLFTALVAGPGVLLLLKRLPDFISWDGAAAVHS